MPSFSVPWPPQHRAANAQKGPNAYDAIVRRGEDALRRATVACAPTNLEEDR